MASTIESSIGSWQIGAWLTGASRRLLGLLLLVTATFLTLALLGFAPGDPSFNHATTAAISNPMGHPGAVTADLLYQAFGHAVWLLPLAFMAVGLKLATGRVIAHPWLPVAALPVGLLALCALLATWPVASDTGWHLRAGYGGLVGDLELTQLQPHIGNRAVVWGAGLTALIMGVLSLGLGWGESVTTAKALGRRSAVVGRSVGGAAAAATSAATSASTRVLQDGLRRLERRRPIGAAVWGEGREPEEDTAEVERRGVFDRLADVMRRGGRTAPAAVAPTIAEEARAAADEPDDFEDQQDHPDPLDEPPRRSRRPTTRSRVARRARRPFP